MGKPVWEMGVLGEGMEWVGVGSHITCRFFLKWRCSMPLDIAYFPNSTCGISKMVMSYVAILFTCRVPIGSMQNVRYQK